MIIGFGTFFRGIFGLILDFLEYLFLGGRGIESGRSKRKSRRGGREEVEFFVFFYFFGRV